MPLLMQGINDQEYVANGNYARVDPGVYRHPSLGTTERVGAHFIYTIPVDPADEKLSVFLDLTEINPEFIADGGLLGNGVVARKTDVLINGVKVLDDLDPSNFNPYGKSLENLNPLILHYLIPNDGKDFLTVEILDDRYPRWDFGAKVNWVGVRSAEENAPPRAIRINAVGPDIHSLGKQWNRDKYFQGGGVYHNEQKFSCPHIPDRTMGRIPVHNTCSKSP